LLLINGTGASAAGVAGAAALGSGAGSDTVGWPGGLAGSGGLMWPKVPGHAHIWQYVHFVFDLD